MAAGTSPAEWSSGTPAPCDARCHRWRRGDRARLDRPSVWSCSRALRGRDSGLLVALATIGIGTNHGVLAFRWFLAQSGENFAFAAHVASLADQLSDKQYGNVSGLVGIAQIVGIMVGTRAGSLFTSNMMLLLLVPGIIGRVLMLIHALGIPEPVLTVNKYPFNSTEFIQSFWTNPFKFPDFGLVWWGRFMIVLGSYLLMHADTLGFFYMCEAIMGFAYGAYVAVDLALAFDVIPDRKNPGKDLGVFNMANALPQSLAPGLGGVVLAKFGGGTDFTALLILAAVVAVIGAVLTMFIRKVK